MSLRKTLLLGIAGAAMAASLPAMAQNSTPRTLSYPTTGVDLGNGWDSQSVQKTSAVCIEFDTAQSQKGQETTMERTLVTDKYSYSNALNISADVQVKSASGASVDAKSTYASKKQLDSSYMNLVDMVTVNNGWVYAAPKAASAGLQASRPLNGHNLASRSPAELQHQQQVHQTYAAYFANVGRHRTVKEKNEAFAIALQRMYLDAGRAAKTAPVANSTLQGPPPPPPPPPHLRAAGAPPALAGSAATIRLTDDMAKLASSNPTEFKRVCGDSFVSAIQQGGELAVTYTFLTTSLQQQQDIGASLGVSYGTPVVSGSATVSVAQAISSSSEKTSTSISYYKTGGSGDPIPTDLNSIDSVTQGFAASVASAPFAYQITVTDYTALPNYPSGSAGMPPLSGFDLVAWEFGKAQTLATSASSIYTALGKPDADSNYMLARWGYTRQDILNTAGAAQQRVNAVQAVAQKCIGSATAQIATNCAISIYDDLTPRQFFPLPVSAGNVSEIMTALWGSNDDYQTTLFDRWIGDLNDNRCYVRPADPAFCKNIQQVAALQSGIKVGKPGKVALELVDKPGQCLNYGTVNSYVSSQVCPSSNTSSQFFFTYDPVAKRLHPAANTGQCILTIRIAVGLNHVTPGYGVMGLADCNAQNALEEITRTWEFRASLDSSGRPDNTGFYMVVADPNSNESNSCLDSTSNSSAWVAPCSHPMRVRFWRVAPN